MAIVQYKNFAYLKGPEGDRGLKGDKGDRGPKGDQGPIGLTGPQGPKGEGSFTGGTLTLPLILSGNPTSPLEAVTRQYVDNIIDSIPEPIYSTDDIGEGEANLYYTDDRARAAISGSGVIAYNPVNGVISFTGSYATQADIDTAIANLIDSSPELLNTLNELSNALSNDPNFAASIATSLNAKLNTADFTNTANAWLATKSTTDLVEGANKYYTDARARNAISAGVGISYDSATGVINTNNIPNSSLANSSITIGSTAISLGATATSVEGLTLSNPTINGAVIGGSLIPNTDIAYDLGTPTQRFRDLFLSGSSIKLGNATITDSISGIKFNGNTVVTVNDVGTVTNTMLAGGSIANDKLANSSVTIVAGTGLSGGGTVNLGSSITLNNTITQYTDAMARNAISVSGSLSYNSSTGVISYTTPTTIASLSNHTTSALVEGTNLYYTEARVDANFSTKTTTALAEGTNLYFTNTRSRNAISVGGSLSYNSSTGVISYTTPTTIASLSNHTTTNLVEGTNLYYTDARVDANFATKSTTNLVEGSNLYFTNERVDDRLDNLIVAGKGLNKTYDDVGNLLNIAVDFSEFNIDDITEGAVNLYFNNKSTTNLVEGTNLYFTDARAVAANKTIIDNVIADTASNLATEVTRATLAETILQTNIDTEISFRIAADLTLTTDLNNESARALAAETILSNDLVAEITRASLAETVLSNSITDEATARVAGDLTNANAINAETNRATSAENTIAINLTNEVNRATTAENNLANDLTAEVNRATSAENTIASNLTNEVNRATTAEGILTSAIASEESARIQAISDEANARISADTTLQTNINSEESARIASDTVLQNSIDAEVIRATAAEGVLTSDLATEATARLNADNTLTSNLATEVTRATTAEGVLATNLASEEAARITGDSTNATAISDEVNRATAAEFSLSSNLSDEILRATNAENAISTNLTNEVNRAVTAENNLANDLTAEETARITADNNLQSQIDFIVENIDPAALDSLTEIVAAFQNADNDINGAIINLGSTLQNNIDVEEQARIASDTTLTNDLTAEINRASSAESVLTTNLAAEVTRATNAENAEAIARANAITAEEQARITGDTANATAITNEVVRATTAESQLQSNLDNEAIVRYQADVDIGIRIDNLTTDNIAEGSNLYYTTARANADFDTRLATKTTTDLAEGDNLYYTDARARNSISVEGTLYYDAVNGIISTFSSNVPSEVRLGSSAGLLNQGFSSIAIGTGAGNENQGKYSIAIGAFAGRTNQAENSIILSAVTPGPGWDNPGDDWDELSWDVINDSVTATTPGFFVKPVRNVNTTNPIYYDPITGEISYGEFPDFALTSYVDAADEQLQNNLDNETNTRIASDDFINQRIDNLTTSDISEFGNLYYTEARVDANFATKTTTALTEGDNLYYTEARVDANFRTKTTTALIEGDNLYYTDARARAAISAGNGLNYNVSTGEISIGQDVGTQADVTFNDVIVTGNLIVQGTTTNVNSTTVDIADLNLTLAKGSANSSLANGAGITIDGANATITYLSADDSWNINKTLNVSGAVILSADPINSLEAVTKNYVDTQINSTLAATHSGNFTHTQSVASTQWLINHNLGARFVDIEIIDADGTAYDGRFDYPSISFEDPDNAVITFTEPLAGWAVVSHGVAVIGDVTELANVAVTGSYLDLRDAPPLSTRTGTHTHTQDVAEYQWTINHGLGTRFVDIEIIDAEGVLFDGRFDYPTITFVDADTLTVTFSEEQAGWAVISHGVTVMKNVTELANVAVSGSYLDLRDTPPLSTRTGTYTHEQANPRIEWTVNHRLGTRFVDVEIVDENGVLFDGRFDYPTITFVDIDTLTVTFSEAQRGWAVISHGVTVIDDVTELADIARTADYSDLRNTPELFSGSYNDLTDKPTNYLSVTGGTMTGSLILNSDPGSNLEAATKQYVDAATNSIVTSYNDLTDKPTIPSDISELTDNYNLLGSGGSGSGASTWADITFDGGNDYVDTGDNYNNSEVILESTDLDAPVAGSAPATSSSTGVPGQVAYDDNYVYVCVAVNTWKRSPLTSW